VCSDGVAARQLLGVECKTESSLYTRSEGLGVTEGKYTSVVHLRLDESSRVEVCLGANFDFNAVRAPVGVVDRLSTRLDVAAHAVVVAGAIAGEALAGEQGDGVFWCAEAKAGSVLGDLAGADVVSRLCAEEEAVMAEDSISSESWALEDVERCTGVEAGHLVGGGEGGILDSLLRSLLRVVRMRILGVEARSEVDLEAVDDLVIELDVGEEGVCVVPALGEGEAVLAVGVLRLDVADDGALGGLVASDLEDDV